MDILKNACETICASLNAYLDNIEKRPTPWVLLTSPVEHNGSVNPAINDTVVMAVYRVSREAFSSSYQPAAPATSTAAATTGIAVRSPPVYIDLHLMFLANFAGPAYGEGLAALSRVISFFQQTPTFTAQNAPALDPAIPQLTMEMEDLEPVDINYVMGMLGTRYLPSVFYKVRMLPFASTAMLARTYPVSAAQGAARQVSS